MVRTPRLCASLRACESFGESVDALEHQLARDVTLILREHDTTEVVLKVLADYEDQLAEASVDGVVDAVVHDGLAVRAELVQLLEAAVTAAHSCCEEEKCWFHIY